MSLTPDVRSTVLVVDDTPENLLVLGEILQPEFRVRVANGGVRALVVAHTKPCPDLILLDVMMPGLDGFAVLERLRGDPVTAEVPVIFVTALDAVQDEERGLALGAVDYITKPVRAAIVRARVRTHLLLKHARDALALRNDALEAEVARRVREGQIAQDVSIRALASLAETRDPETGNHLRRTQAYVQCLAQRLKDHPRFRTALSPRGVRMIVQAAPLHDIGKVGIPDHILLKHGRLTGAEYAVMQTHSRIGSDAIDDAMRGAMSETEYAALREHCRLGHAALAAALAGPGAAADPGPLEFLLIAQEIARSHHECWDGSGYPDGLQGDDIPVAARLMALADVFDALVFRRVYKPAMAVDAAIEEIRVHRGTHFDPDVVDAFLADQGRFRAIAGRYAEDERHRMAALGVYRDRV
ncbi:HD-GYP domain-containing protein [Candidatus Thiodictyon syntrophicum]|jgi:putative two-component system response regulator|uniref:Two-component system response regulator n=1 Tax=Candidatus Thiodictyon syntrophicum TaxID=1166950 RepID=A0A2K8U761_9GAMM|nr:HD domain-containing phosphohydrolase [Candidatus Thiodictyon syntrophicum]AUB81430.1 two-component system response regulator [Candidatus Thiodictyon syntrophicum]